MVLTLHLYRRLMRRGRLFWLVLLASVPGIIFALAGLEESPEELDELFVGIMIGVGFAYSIAALILTVSTLRDERDAGTLPYIYMRPIRRMAISAASIGAGVMAALTIALGGWFATLLAGFVNGAGIATTGPGIVLLGSAAFGYAAVFVPIGYLFSRSLLVGLGYVILVELVLAPLVSGLSQLSIWNISSSIFLGTIEDWSVTFAGELPWITPGIGGGVVKLASVLVVGLLVLTWALRRRDTL